MPAQLTVDEILKRAIQKEIVARLLYTDLQQRMKGETARNAFGELAQQELRHQQFLEKYLRGELKRGALSHKHAVDFKLAEHLDQPEITSDLPLKDVYLLAANREKASHQLYLALAGIHPRGRVKDLLIRLAEEELEHKRRVEFLHSETAFPQTDGG